tara:strand:+ start:475 stop:738 length:264 start_codon:yes stop_codon:yes gene_type:complete
MNVFIKIYDFIENFINQDKKKELLKKKIIKSKSLNNLDDISDNHEELLCKIENINSKLNMIRNDMNLSSKIYIGIYLSSFLFYYYKK